MGAEAAGPGFGAKCNAATVDVALDAGRAQGEVLDGGEVCFFVAIPYASLPTGPLRWRRPRPVDRCTVEACTPLVGETRGEGGGSGSAASVDDCLNVGIWAPKAHFEDSQTELKPVLVWIGTSDLVNIHPPNSPGPFSGADYAERGIVYVSVGLRLGALGFVCPPGGDANCGLWDVAEALRWVNREIHHFGGDALRVTLAGHGGGADCAMCLCVSPVADGLLQRAVLMSPGAFTVSREQAQELSEEFVSQLTAAGARDASGLQEASTDAILLTQRAGSFALRPPSRVGAQLGLTACPAANPPAGPGSATPAGMVRTPPRQGMPRPCAVVDGELLTDHPLDTLAAGHTARGLEAVIIGSAQGDCGLDGAGAARLGSRGEILRRLRWELCGAPWVARAAQEGWDDTELRVATEGIVAACESALQRGEGTTAEEGAPAQPEERLWRAAASGLGSGVVHLAAERLARLLPGRVYRYDFAGFGGRIGLSGAELQLVTGDAATLNGSDTAASQVRSHWMNSYAQFARTGDPNIPGTVCKWQPYEMRGSDGSCGFVLRWDGVEGCSTSSPRSCSATAQFAGVLQRLWQLIPLQAEPSLVLRTPLRLCACCGGTAVNGSLGHQGTTDSQRWFCDACWRSWGEQVPRQTSATVASMAEEKPADCGGCGQKAEKAIVATHLGTWFCKSCWNQWGIDNASEDDGTRGGTWPQRSGAGGGNTQGLSGRPSSRPIGSDNGIAVPQADGPFARSQDWLACVQCGVCSKVGKYGGERWFCKECWEVWEHKASAPAVALTTSGTSRDGIVPSSAPSAVPTATGIRQNMPSGAGHSATAACGQEHTGAGDAKVGAPQMENLKRKYKKLETPTECVRCRRVSDKGLPVPEDEEPSGWRCSRCWRAIDLLRGLRKEKQKETFTKLIQKEGGWETLARFYTDPNRTNSKIGGQQPSVGFQLERKDKRPRLRAFGAARQLIEESRSIFINNLTNLVNSVAIAHQFFQKADEDQDGQVSRAQFRRWVKGMITADAYAGLDHEMQVAEVVARALGTTPEFEKDVGPMLDRASRKRGVGTTRDSDGPVLGAPPESWVRKGRGADEDSDDSASEASDLSTNSADSTGTMTPTSSSSDGEDYSERSLLAAGAGGGATPARRVDPDKLVAFEDFKKAVDALSLKTLLRTDGVRNEVPTSEDPGESRAATVVAERTGSLPTLWDDDVDDGENLRKNKVRKAWEDAYSTGKNCIWVVPEADQDVRRVLNEGWFETKGICLELGCGLGYDAIAFAEAGFDVIGVDISETAVAAAREMARAKGFEEQTRFLCEDAYELPTPTRPVALIWDNTLFQNAHRGDRYGTKWKYNSARYKELLLRLTVPGSLVMMNVMSSELTEGHLKLAERGFYLPLTSAMRLAMEFVEYFEFLFFRNGIYDMNSLFIHEASQIGYEKPAALGGLPSWCVLMRRREVPKPYIPTLPAEEPFLVASQVLARDGFKKPTQPKFLKRLVEEEWGEQWGEGPKSGLMLTDGGDDDEEEGKSTAPSVKALLDPGPLDSVGEDSSLDRDASVYLEDLRAKMGNTLEACDGLRETAGDWERVD